MGIYEPYLINAPRSVESREALPLAGIPVPLTFFYVENLKGIPVPVEKNRGSRNSTSPAPSMYVYVNNITITSSYQNRVQAEVRPLETWREHVRFQLLDVSQVRIITWLLELSLRMYLPSVPGRESINIFFQILA